MKDAQPTAKPAETAEALDESTREILNDYTRKFVTFIQHEKDRVKKQAVEDAEKVVADGERKARAAYEKALRDAKAESAAILARSEGAVKAMVEDVGRLTETIAGLKEKIEKDTADIAARLKKQEEAVAEALRKGEQAIGEASGKLQADLEASGAAVNELRESLLERANQMNADAETEPDVEEPVAERAEGGAGSKARETEPVAEGAKPAEAETGGKTREGAKRHAERTFVGPLKIDLYSGNPALYRRFSEGLAKTPNLEISQIEDAIGDRMRMVVVAGQPVPLLNIISQMAFVRSAVADEDRLKVVLHQTDRWMS